jgi:hypothetical protein
MVSSATWDDGSTTLMPEMTPPRRPNLRRRIPLFVGEQVSHVTLR